MKHFVENFLIFLLANLVRLIRVTCRIKVIDKSGTFYAEKKVQPMVMTVWHNRLLFCPALIKRPFRKQFFTIASLSDDGRYAEAYARNLGMGVVRGSSSRGGARALIQLIRRLKKEKLPLAITIDGPRGPRYSCQPGAAFLAASTGYPVFPYVINSNNYFEFNNWDRTQIPKPFSKIEVVIGEPIYFDKDTSEEAIKKANQQIVDAMVAITVDRVKK